MDDDTQRGAYPLDERTTPPHLHTVAQAPRDVDERRRSRSADGRGESAHFQSLLVSPTRNPVRKQYGEFQPNIGYAKSWPHDVRIGPGTGGYQATTGLAGYYLNPLFDYVSKKIG